MCWGCAAVVQTGINEELCRDDFDAIPFMNADGYHCKTNAVFKTLDHACRSKFAYKKQDTFISANSNLRD